jgi:hypothetical protein
VKEIMKKGTTKLNNKLIYHNLCYSGTTGLFRLLGPILTDLLLGTGLGSDGANTNPKLAVVGWRSPTGKTMDAFANVRWRWS